MRDSGRFIRLGVVAGAFGLAQGRPDFSGEWVPVADAAPARTVAATGDAAFPRGDMGSGWSGPLSIRQTADSLVVQVAHFSTYDLQPKLRSAWPLDGRETSLRVIVGHAGVSPRSRAQWDGGRLVLTTHFAVPAGVRPEAGELRQVLALSDDGSLVVTAVRAGAAAPDTVRVVYRRR